MPENITINFAQYDGCNPDIYWTQSSNLTERAAAYERHARFLPDGSEGQDELLADAECARDMAKKLFLLALEACRAT